MARVWTVNESDCSKVNLLGSSDEHDAIWLENTWHEVSPTHAATKLPDGTKMVDSNNKELTLLDGYCTTYFYKGWQTVFPLMNKKIGNIIFCGSYYNISDNVGHQVANERKGLDSNANWKLLQVVRVRDGVLSLPDNMGKNLIPDLYPGSLWGDGNWGNQWTLIPLAPNDGVISDQYTSFPRIFTIDETQLPAATGRFNSYKAPELFAPYMYLLKLMKTNDDLYLGGIIVVIGVKKLS